MSTRPVRPRHAASLVITRDMAGQTHVLMGRRPARAVFPAAWVFPGGRLDRSDVSVTPAAPLSPDTLEQMRMRGGCTAPLAHALATAAIRETFEETGLLLAAPGSPGRSEGVWAEFGRMGVAPALDRLRFLGRAITPTSAPVRFHARFFTADAGDLTGDLRSNGELLDLDWYPLDTAMTLPAIDVTRFILAEIAAAGRGEARTTPFFRYRRNRPVAGPAND